MRVKLADLRAQYEELKEQIDAAIVAVIESSRFSGGDIVVNLEAEIASLCGAKHGIGVASGTDALTLSLLACNIGRGDEVITTPFTFGATSEAICHVGATPVFVDIDPCTYNLDERQIEAKINSRTKAILPVDLYGQMADRATLSEIAAQHGLRVIYDSAQSIGALQNGRPIAADGDTVTLSFYPTKNLGAYGDGGMILTNNDAIAEMLKSLRGHGTSQHPYLYERIGYCSRLDAIQAAVLDAKLPLLPVWNERRRRNAHLYSALLSKTAEGSASSLTLPSCDASNLHIYHQYTLRHTRRDALQAFLKENEIDTGIYYPLPLHLHPAYANLGYTKSDFPIAERIASEVLSLPVHPELTEEQIEYTAAKVCEFVRANV